ncbi:MAG: hypothetical protein KJO31_17010, partial [Gammaproteobacteria bacterium]|nr:hypothetical protein [Gammaproteobacteria bacterium]
SILIQGLRIDLLLTGLILTVPVISFPFLASNRLLLPAWQGLLRSTLPMVLLAVVLMECSTPSFVNQFDSRPNILLLEYLNNPHTVASSLWADYKIPILVTVILGLIFTWSNVQDLGRLVKRIKPTGFLPALAASPVLLFLCIGMIQASLQSSLASAHERHANADTERLVDPPTGQNPKFEYHIGHLYAMHADTAEKYRVPAPIAAPLPPECGAALTCGAAKNSGKSVR